LAKRRSLLASAAGSRAENDAWPNCRTASDLWPMTS